MAYVKVPAPSVVYHLAKADRLDSILMTVRSAASRTASVGSVRASLK